MTKKKNQHSWHQENYWQAFLNDGSINNYLQFKHHQRLSTTEIAREWLEREENDGDQIRFCPKDDGLSGECPD